MALDPEKQKDIFFKTDKGTYVKLSFAKPEHRAYRQSGLDWIPMNLGGCKEEALMKYIKEKY